MKKKIAMTALFFALSISLYGCGEENQGNPTKKEYSNDNINISSLINENKSNNNFDQDKKILKSINADEYIAVNDYIQSLNNQSIPKDLTLKDVVSDFNILHPSSPIIRGDIKSTYDYYYRDVNLILLQGIGNPKEIGLVRNCLIYGKSDEMKNYNPNLINDFQLGYINNSCKDSNKVEYNTPYNDKDKYKNDDLLVKSKEIQDEFNKDKNVNDIQKSLDKFNLNIDEFLVMGQLMDNTDIKNKNPTLRDFIDYFNKKYPGAPVVRGKMTWKDSYVRDLDMMNKLNQISTQDKDKVQGCFRSILSSKYPYNKIQGNIYQNDLILNIPVYKIMENCKK